MGEKEIKVRLFGAEGAEIHGRAINLLHVFAQETSCPPGHDVIAWFSHMTGVWQDENKKAALRARATRPSGDEGAE